MLTTIGRAAVRRVVTRRPKSTNRTLQSLWQLHRVNNFYATDRSSNGLQPFLSAYRSYRTAAAESSTTSKSKPTAKKATTKKAAAKKPIKKKVVKKAKPKAKKAPKKKVLTEAEKAKLLLKSLKQTALVLPKQLPRTVHQILISEITKTGGTFAEATAKYHALTPSEIEHYNHLANQNAAANTILLKKWVEEHTPDEIRVANNARKQLRKKQEGKAWRVIPDPRLPKQPANPYARFAAERYASGDFKGIKIAEASKLLSSEFKALTPTEKKKYEDLFLADQQRYIQEFKTVFKRDPEFVGQPTS